MANIVESGKVIAKMVTEPENINVAIARLEERVANMHSDMNEMKTDITELRATANRWKGGFWVLMGLGGVLGVLANFIMGWLGKL